MKPFVTLGETVVPGGGKLVLQEHDRHFYLKLNGRQLMSTFNSASEVQMAELACNALSRTSRPHVLIGGLGLGVTLGRLLELISGKATVEVVELLPDVIAWNRQFLGTPPGSSLKDPRVRVIEEDVCNVIRQAPAGTYDAILLDVDNGPIPEVQRTNARLYSNNGLARIAGALKPGGRVLFWSAFEDRIFASRLTRAGFLVTPVEAKTHAGARQSPMRIYVGKLAAPPKPVRNE